MLATRPIKPAPAPAAKTAPHALRAIVVPFLAELRRRAPNFRVSVRGIDEDRLRTQLEQGCGNRLNARAYRARL